MGGASPKAIVAPTDFGSFVSFFHSWGSCGPAVMILYHATNSQQNEFKIVGEVSIPKCTLSIAYQVKPHAGRKLAALANLRAFRKEVKLPNKFVLWLQPWAVEDCTRNESKLFSMLR